MRRGEAALTDLQQREVFIEERIVCGRIEDIEECGLCADVYGQFRACVHASLRVTAVRGHAQVHRGVEVQEYARGHDAPERGQADVDLRDEVARDADGCAGVRDVRTGGDSHPCGVYMSA